MAVNLIAPVDGQLPNTKTTLYTATEKVTLDMKVFNNNATAETVILYFKRTTSRNEVQIVLQATNWYAWVRGIVLLAGDELEGETTTASQVDYRLQGAEQT